MSMIALVIIAIIAVVILFQLYNVLGRKVGFRADDKPVSQTKNDGFDMIAKPEKAVETPRMPNLEILKSRDANFNEINFLEKTRETYEQVVMAFHKGELDPVKDRLAEPVYTVFAKAIGDREATPADSLSFVDTPKADIDVIDFKDEAVQVRVRFLSELSYENTSNEPTETVTASAVPVTRPARTYKRTAEYWTFQKVLRSQGNPWLLTKVEAAKA